MSCEITSQAKQLLIIPLNSGKTIYLAPNECSCPVADFEVNDNQKIAKLLKRKMIRITLARPKAAASSPATVGARRTSGEESAQGAEEAAVTTAPIPATDEEGTRTGKTEREGEDESTARSSVPVDKGEESRRNLSTNKKK
ncbi:MAG: hypothetical protein ISS70_18315 [Phycisphaerae bacterium]|nr:hypothetical protein [Phycisphaerae bacterium]